MQRLLVSRNRHPVIHIIKLGLMGAMGLNEFLCRESLFWTQN